MPALLATSSALQIPPLASRPELQSVLLVDPKQQLDELSSTPEFEKWVSDQSVRSFSYILENIGGVSQTLDPEKVHPGTVIASPLKVRPNYFYNWIRDSALTMRTLIYHMNDHLSNSTSMMELRRVIEQYIEVNYRLQRVPNKSGTFNDPKRKGLGEPKFLTNGQAFDERWGRPQSDGPGLRVSTILGYLFFLKGNNLEIESDFLGNVTFIYNKIIKPDLEYIIANWREKLFDLWEEIESHHFFNALTQLKALQDGQRFTQLHVMDMTFARQLQLTYHELLEYVTNSGGFTRPLVSHIIETPEFYEKGVRSGLDAAIFLAALHAHNLEFGGTDNIPYDVDDSHILNSITAMAADMKTRYPINIRHQTGLALGRYPEDVYDGYGTSLGNPWFISTLSAGEVLYKWIYKYTRRHADIVIDKLNIEFFQPHDKELQNDGSLENGVIVISYNSDRYQRILKSLYKYADTFLQVVLRHVDRHDGSMSEQFDRNTGYMQGAEKLTWSYSAFHNCVRWRTKAADQIRHLHNQE